MRLPVLALAALCSLASCGTPAATAISNANTKVVAATTTDLNNAAAEAKAAGDTEGQACFTFLSSLVKTLDDQAVAQEPAVTGVASAYEAAHIGATAVQSGVLSGTQKTGLENACGPYALNNVVQINSFLAKFGIKYVVQASAVGL